MSDDRKATVAEADAVLVLVKGLRPNWEHVAEKYVRSNADLMDVHTFVRRAIGAATDPTVVLPGDMLIWEPRREEDEKPDTHRKLPAAVPIEQFNKATRCGHGAITGECALCREGLPAEDRPRRGLPRPADPSVYVPTIREMLATVEPPPRLDKKPEG